MDKQTAKLIARIAENLPDMDSNTIQKWIEHPIGLQHALEKILWLPTNQAATVTNFDLWRTVKLGTGLRTENAFLGQLKEHCHYHVTNAARIMLSRPDFTTVDREIEIELTVASAAELGFKAGATREDIYRRAHQLGLGLCPNEVGPQLCLQYKDQPDGEWVLIGMEPIIGAYNNPYIFSLERDGDGHQWLRGSDGKPGCSWKAHNRFVFMRDERV